MARRKRKSIFEQEPQFNGSEELDVLEWPTAIYSRLSIENSGKDDKGESIEGQIELCRDYIEEHPYLHLVDTYVDNGWTGTNINRPAFQRLLDDIKGGKIKALVIKDFSRFSRDYIEAGNLLENIFPAYGVRFISVADRYDSFETDGSAQSLLIPLKNLINSYYSKDISRKVSTAVHAKQMAAEHIPSMIPYGYIKSTSEKYRFMPDPETRDNVTRIFQQRIDGVPINQIAKRLDADGIPCPGKLRFIRGQTTDKRYADSKWSAQLIKQILRNPTYLGNLVFGRMPTALYLGKPDYHYEPDESKWRVLEGMHEPLVTQEMFDKVKEMEQAGRNRHAAMLAKNEEYRKQNVPLFHDCLFCGDCGAHMRYHRSYYHAERMTGSYECPNKKYGRCERTHTITQDMVKSIVWQSMQDQLTLCCDFEKVLELLNDGRTTSLMESYRNELQRLTVQLNNRRYKREHLYEDFTDGILTPEEYTFMKKRFDDEYQELTEKINELQMRMARLKRSLSDKNYWMIHTKMLVEATEITPELLNALVDKIFVYHDADNTRRIEIQYKYGADFETIKAAYKELIGGTKE